MVNTISYLKNRWTPCTNGKLGYNLLSNQNDIHFDMFAQFPSMTSTGVCAIHFYLSSWYTIPYIISLALFTSAPCLYEMHIFN